MSKEERLEEQYKLIAEAIEAVGIGYAIYPGGHISPYTDDEELNEAIREAYRGMEKILEIVEPYR